MQPRSLQRADEPQIGGSRVVPLFFVSFQSTANRAGEPQLYIVLTAAKRGRDLPSIPPQNYEKRG